jgi:hypothetical protein
VLLLGEGDVEAVDVEVDDRVEVRGEAVVEIRDGASKTQASSMHCNPFAYFQCGGSRC